VEILKISQPKISRHLAYLRRAQIVAARREGKWMHYRLAEPPDDHAARIFREVRASLVEHPEFERDREKLEKVCCAVQLPVQLRRAPRPSTVAA
jgi:ArsR family transcriptional regulator